MTHMGYRTAGWTSAIVGLIAVSGCSDEPNARDEIVRRDSAGVEIVESMSPAWSNNEWTVDPAPVRSIGLLEGEAPYLFGSISGAAQLGDGSIVVADDQAKEIRFFDRVGRFRKSVGRQGEGPGEFSSLSSVWRCGEDRLYTMDRQRQRVAAWTHEGALVREFRITEPGAESRIPYRSICSPRGDFLVAGWGNTRALAGLRTSQFVPHIAPVWVLDSLARPVAELGQFQIADRVFFYDQETGAGGAGPNPFGRAAQFAMDSQFIYIGTSERLEVLQFNRTGELGTIMRGPELDLTIGEDIMSRYAGGEAPTRDSSTVARMVQHELPLPSGIPAFVDMKVDPQGHVWLERFALPWDDVSRWGVFSPEGVFLGHVEMPRGLDILEIGSDYVLGIAKDEFDVERVQTHQLTRNAEAPASASTRK